MEVHNHPVVVISPEDQHTIEALVDHAVDQGYGECSFLGFGRRTDYGAIVEKIVSPKQENSSGASDMDEAHVHELCQEMFQEGLLLVWWGHSHGKMNSFFSSTDWSTFHMLTGTKPENFFASVYSTTSERHDVLFTPQFTIEGLDIISDSETTPDISEHVANWTKSVPAYKLGPKFPPVTTAKATTPMWNEGRVAAYQAVEPEWFSYICPSCNIEQYLDDHERDEKEVICLQCNNLHQTADLSFIPETTETLTNPHR